MPEIIGVQFQRVGKIYYFDSSEANIDTDTNVIVETARGVEYARVALATHWVPEEDIVPPLKSYIRIANEEDDAQYQQNLLDAEEAYDICVEKIELCKLDMKLVNVEYTFDRSKIIFNFTADERVDFRDLIKELAAVFHTRIELRQIGVRDEAKIIGGIGICGQPLCCHRFLNDFSPVSIKMAKEQNLSLNPNKISGCCGRLLCCLNYENEHYVESNRLAREQAKAERACCCNGGDCPAARLSEDYDVDEERTLHLGNDEDHHDSHEHRESRDNRDRRRKPRKPENAEAGSEGNDKPSRKPRKGDLDTSIIIEDYHGDSESHEPREHRDKHSRNSSHNRKPRNNSDRSKSKRSSRRNEGNEERFEKTERTRKPRNNKHYDRNRNDRNKNNGKPQA